MVGSSLSVLLSRNAAAPSGSVCSIFASEAAPQKSVAPRDDGWGGSEEGGSGRGGRWFSEEEEGPSRASDAFFRRIDACTDASIDACSEEAGQRRPSVDCATSSAPRLTRAGGAAAAAAVLGDASTSFVVFPSGKIMSWNRRMEEMSGYTQVEMLYSGTRKVRMGVMGGCCQAMHSCVT